MTDINHFELIGRITKNVTDDERSFSYVGNGTAKAVVSIAVNRSSKKGDEWVDEVSFFDVVIWGKMAEGLKPYLNKGTQIAVVGYLKQDRWEKDGQKFSKVSLVAENVQLLGGNKKDGDDNKPKFEAIPEKKETPENEEFHEDIPF